MLMRRVGLSRDSSWTRWGAWSFSAQDLILKPTLALTTRWQCSKWARLGAQCFSSSCLHHIWCPTGASKSRRPTPRQYGRGLHKGMEIRRCGSIRTINVMALHVTYNVMYKGMLGPQPTHKLRRDLPRSNPSISRWDQQTEHRATAGAGWIIVGDWCYDKRVEPGVEAAQRRLSEAR